MSLSRLTVIGSVGLWISIIALGAALERFINLSRPVLFGAVMMVSALALYPIVKQWHAERRGLTFKRWALGMLFASVVTIAILYVLNLWI